MIPLTQKSEPEDFDTKVRKKGKAYLKRISNPTTKQWKNHAYWVAVKNELRGAFDDICAYSCHWVPDDTGWATCEHFLDKFGHPDMAYEWNNYRFVCGILNGRKGKKVVIDPVGMRESIFFIDFPSLLVKPFDDLSDAEYDSAINTINNLGLNNEDTCIKSRQKYVMEFRNNCITFEFLERHAPFIAKELRRQNIVESIKEIMITDL